MYDNGNFSSQYLGTSNISRAVEYLLDTVLMTAEKVWEYVHPDSLYTPSIGSAQRLPNGNTLINFGNLQALNIGSIVTEVDSNGQIVFQLEYDEGVEIYIGLKNLIGFFTLLFLVVLILAHVTTILMLIQTMDLVIYQTDVEILYTWSMTLCNL